MTVSRRKVLAYGAAAPAAGLFGLGPAHAQNGEVYDLDALLQGSEVEDRWLGEADAPVTVIEYVSPTCPICAAFHLRTFPEFKETYVDTGEVRFLIRPFLRNVLDAVVFLLAESTGTDEGYYLVIDTYFDTYEQWTASERPRDAMLEIAQQLGFTEESFEAALTNQELFGALEATTNQALQEFGVTGTPTFYVNGKRLSGQQSLEQLAAEIDPLLG